MSKRQRLAMLGMAAVIAAVAVAIAVASGGDDETEPARPSTAAQPTTTSTADTTDTTPAPAPEPPIERIRIKGGQPVGGVKKLTFKSGERVEFEVRSDVADEVHVHGYDLSKDVSPGKTVKFSFKGTIEGVFEVELEHAGVEILTLQVEP